MTPRVDHITGATYHGRRGQVDNAFRYSIDYVALDAEAAVSAPWLFGRGRAALASVHDVDHGGTPKAGQGAVWVRGVLNEAGITADRIELLAQPRILGHVFNPVSFWLCYQSADLIAVIAEVSNTYGDRHSYLCHHPDHRAITPQDMLQAAKVFHVSPFQKVAGDYTFRFDIRADRIGIWIDYRSEKGGLYTNLTGRRAPLTNAGILRACLRRPFGSRRVLALIHWQALKLWWKGAPWQTRPEPPSEQVSR